MSCLQERVADLAYQYVLEEIERTNSPTEEHRRALRGLVELMAGMTTGGIERRLAIGMPTGAGKTTAMACFLRALHDLDAWRLQSVERADGILVAQSRVEQLCDLKRHLVEHGVPERLIGLIYSHRTATYNAQWRETGRAPGEVSEPTDVDAPGVEDRPIVLVTQARVRGRRGDGVSQIDRFTQFRHQPRTVLYDEALVTTEALGIKVTDLGPGIGALSRCDAQERLRPAIDYLERALEMIQVEVERQKAGKSAVGSYIQLPSLDSETVDAWTRAVDGTRLRDVEKVKSLLAMSQDRLRVLAESGGGVVQHRVLVPETLRRIIVLDASYQVSRLVRLDPTLHDAEHVTRVFAGVGKPLAQLKDWSRVTVHQMRAPGGRDSMTRTYKSGDSALHWPSREIANVLKANPGRPALIFNYKEKHGLSIEKRLRTDLRESGIDLAEVVRDAYGRTARDEYKRAIPLIRFATWGSHDASNQFQDVELVIMNGVILRDRLELAATALGQAHGAQDVEQVLGGDAVHELQQAEAASAVFQAGSRGQCRRVDGALARQMDWYVIHRGLMLRKLLDPVMPGAVWVEWPAPRELTTTIRDAAAKLVTTLDRLEQEGTKSISSRDLKVEAGMQRLHRSSFSDALTAALERTRGGWVRVGRSVMRFADRRPATAAA